jgi:hypothetical protein
MHGFLRSHASILANLDSSEFRGIHRGDNRLGGNVRHLKYFARWNFASHATGCHAGLLAFTE